MNGVQQILEQLQTITFYQRRFREQVQELCGVLKEKWKSFEKQWEDLSVDDQEFFTRSCQHALENICNVAELLNEKDDEPVLLDYLHSQVSGIVIDMNNCQKTQRL